mgnify:CR=1 FL=1|jgi:hypothetical protein
MKNIENLKLLLMPFELILITLITLIASIILSSYLICSIVFDLMIKGYKNGLRRNIT